MKAVFLVALSLLMGSCGGGGSGGGGGYTAGVTGTTNAGAGAGSGTAALQGDGGVSGASSGGTSSAGGAAGSATAAASGGDDSSGVGSGGTGVSASAVGIGSADGLGSVIVNGVRYNTDNAVFSVQDATQLQLGMSVKVTGPVNGNFTAGTATSVESAAELRGVVSNIDLASGTFAVLGTNVSTDADTVWADASGLSGIASGAILQVWGLPSAAGMLRATRVSQLAGTTGLIATGTVQNLDRASGVFAIGGLNVNFANSAFTGGLTAGSLANGVIVRVRAELLAGPESLNAASVQSWYPLAQATGQSANLDGVVTDYAGLASFKVLGVRVDASGAQITGGPASGIGNGVKLEVAGVFAGGVLRATKLKIRHVPGTGGPSSFTLIGTVGAFSSPASFRVRGQPVDASGAGVAYPNGTPAGLGNGVKLTVTGSQVINGVLLADTVTYD